MSVKRIAERLLFISITLVLSVTLIFVFIGVPFIEQEEENIEDINVSEASFPTTLDSLDDDPRDGWSIFSGSANTINITSESGIDNSTKLLDEHRSQLELENSGHIIYHDSNLDYSYKWSGSEALIDENDASFYVEYDENNSEIYFGSDSENANLTDESYIMMRNTIYRVSIFGDNPDVHHRTPNRNTVFTERISEILEKYDYEPTDAWHDVDQRTDYIKYVAEDPEVNSVLVVTDNGRIVEFEHEPFSQNTIIYESRINDNIPLFKPSWAIDNN